MGCLRLPWKPGVYAVDFTPPLSTALSYSLLLRWTSLSKKPWGEWGLELVPWARGTLAGWQEYDRFPVQQCTAGEALTSYAVGFCCVCSSLCFAVQKPFVFQGFLLAVGLRLWASDALSWKSLLLPALEPLLLPLTASEGQILRSSLWSIWSWFL